MDRVCRNTRARRITIKRILKRGKLQLRPICLQAEASKYIGLARSFALHAKDNKFYNQWHFLPYVTIHVKRVDKFVYAYISVPGGELLYEFFVATPQATGFRHEVKFNIAGRFCGVNNNFGLFYRFGAETATPDTNWKTVDPVLLPPVPYTVTSYGWDAARGPRYVHWLMNAEYKPLVRSVSNYNGLPPYGQKVVIDNSPALAFGWFNYENVLYTSVGFSTPSVYVGDSSFNLSALFDHIASDDFIMAVGSQQVTDSSGNTRLFIVAISRFNKLLVAPLKETFAPGEVKVSTLPFASWQSVTSGKPDTQSVWRFNSTGTKIVGISSDRVNGDVLFTRDDMIHKYRPSTNTINITMYSLADEKVSIPAGYTENLPIWDYWPGLIEIGINIVINGENLSDFSVSTEILQDIHDSEYYFICCDYAVKNTHLENRGVFRDDLIIVRINLYETDTEITTDTYNNPSNSEEGYTWFELSNAAVYYEFVNLTRSNIVKRYQISQGLRWSSKLVDNPFLTHNFATRELMMVGESVSGLTNDNFPMTVKRTIGICAKTLSIALFSSMYKTKADFDNRPTANSGRLDVYALVDKKIYAETVYSADDLTLIPEEFNDRSTVRILGQDKRALFHSIFGATWLPHPQRGFAYSYRGDVSIASAYETFTDGNQEELKLDAIAKWNQDTLDFIIKKHLDIYNSLFADARTYSAYEPGSIDQAQTWRTWGFWL